MICVCDKPIKFQQQDQCDKIKRKKTNWDFVFYLCDFFLSRTDTQVSVQNVDRSTNMNYFLTFPACF